MAFTVNQVTLLGGNLTRDAELKFAKSGQAILRFDIAMNKGYYDRQTQQWVKQDPDFFRIVYWGKPAEAIANALRKGTKVAIEGKLSQNRWTTEDGQTRSIVEVVANSVFVIERVQDSGMGGERQADSYSQQQPAAGYSNNPGYAQPQTQAADFQATQSQFNGAAGYSNQQNFGPSNNSPGYGPDFNDDEVPF